jgi:2-polyprenyl-6-hydroxyphenyl methylase/3-demethylubiquinone-9 3-methyltransferase
MMAHQTPGLATPGGFSASSGVRARPDELARYNRLAATWWNPLGPMRPLHVLNDLRRSRVQALVETHFGRAPGAGLAGLRVLDVGCGAGLLCEPLARAGAHVTGIDAAGRSIAIARDHAGAQGLPIDYREGDPHQALGLGARFDVLLLLEVVEHVQDLHAFVRSALAHLAPGGIVIASTINRSWRSFFFAIVGAEWVLRLLPRGTHRWSDFVTPAELAGAMAAGGLCQQSLTGLRYTPVLHRAQWCRSTAVNYLASFAAPAATLPGFPPLRLPEQQRGANNSGH